MLLRESNYLSLLRQNSMMEEIVSLREEKIKKQEEMKPKFRKMHIDKKAKVHDEIEVRKREIEEFTAQRTLEDAHNIYAISENLKQVIQSLQDKVKEIRYEEIHLNTGFDAKLDIDESAEKFTYYAVFWKFANEWEYVRII